jgi:hypothetical protein
MKKIELNLTTSDYLAIVLLIIGTTIALYQQEIKILIAHIMEKWRIILLIFCAAGLVHRFILIYVRNKIDFKFSTIESLNNQLIENIKTNQVYQHINTAIVCNLITDMCNNAKDKREAATALFSHFETNRISIPEWKNYGIPLELITEMEIVYHETKTKKLKQQQNDSTRNI